MALGRPALGCAWLPDLPGSQGAWRREPSHDLHHWTCAVRRAANGYRCDRHGWLSGFVTRSESTAVHRAPRLGATSAGATVTRIFLRQKDAGATSWALAHQMESKAGCSAPLSKGRCTSTGRQGKAGTHQ